MEKGPMNIRIWECFERYAVFAKNKASVHQFFFVSECCRNFRGDMKPVNVVTFIEFCIYFSLYRKVSLMTPYTLMFGLSERQIRFIGQISGCQR